MWYSVPKAFFGKFPVEKERALFLFPDSSEQCIACWPAPRKEYQWE